MVVEMVFELEIRWEEAYLAAVMATELIPVLVQVMAAVKERA
jgi:hypothetical protein